MVHTIDSYLYENIKAHLIDVHLNENPLKSLKGMTRRIIRIKHSLHRILFRNKLSLNTFGGDDCSCAKDIITFQQAFANY